MTKRISSEDRFEAFVDGLMASMEADDAPIAAFHGCGPDDRFERNGDRRLPRVNEGGEPSWM